MSNKYSIYTRKGSNMRYLNIFGKRMSTGVPDSPIGRKLVKQQAEKMLVERLENAEIIEPIKKSGIADVANEYFDFLASKKRMSGTIYTIKNALNHVNYLQNYVLTEKNIERRLKGLLSSDLQPRTINSVLGKLTTFLKWAKKFKYIDEEIDVVKYRERERTNERPSHSPAEIVQILAKANEFDREFYLLIKFITLTGFRITETLQLKMSDFHLEQGYIEVPNKIQKSFLQKFPITTAIREVYDELTGMKSSRKANKENLFRWSYTSKSRLTRWLKKIKQELGFKIDRRGFHGFRRAFSNQLFDSELPLEVIKELMRHSDISLTMELYKSYNANHLTSQLERVHCAKTVQ